MEILAYQTSRLKTELEVVVSNNLAAFTVNICVIIRFGNFLMGSK